MMSNYMPFEDIFVKWVRVSLIVDLEVATIAPTYLAIDGLAKTNPRHLQRY